MAKKAAAGTPPATLPLPDVMPPFPKKRGRPTEYDEDFAIEVCERIAGGEGLKAICDTKNRSHSTVLGWAVFDVNGFSDRYAKACITRAMLWAEEIQSIADDGRNDWMTREDPLNGGYVANGEHIARSRLRVDTRKWMLSKMLPKVFGDKIQHVGDGGGAIKHESAIDVTRIPSQDRDYLRLALQAAMPDEERPVAERGRMQ